MPYPDILIANLSSLPDADVEKAIAAWQRQVSLDFAPIWGVSAVLHYNGPHALAGDEWGITITDKSAADYLGEHHLENVPRGVVLLGACKAAGDDWQEVGSHENLELLGDPWANICIELTDGTIEANEACDAVQGSGYDIDGVPVANFIYPLGYFCECGTQYDKQGALSAPHTKTAGGYRLIRPPGGQWTQDEGERVSGMRQLGAISPWSRRGRRIARRRGALKP